MSKDKPKINEVPVGAPYIPKKTMDEIVDASNRFNSMSFSPQSNKITMDDGKNINVLGTDEKGTFPFEVVIKNNNKIAITKADWTRSQTSVTLDTNATSGVLEEEFNDDVVLIDISSFMSAGVVDVTPEIGVPYYVYVQLGANASASTTEINFDEALLPGKLDVFVDRDKITAHSRTYSDAVNEIVTGVDTRDLWVKDREVIAIVYVDENADASAFWINNVIQTTNEDIVDGQIVPDTLAKTYSDGSHYRSTIEMNVAYDETSETGDETTHFGEQQIANVDECPGDGSKSFPYFESEETNNDAIGPAGTVKWTSPDGNYRPQGAASTFKTLTIRRDKNTANKPIDGDAYDVDTNAFYVLDLYNSETTYASSKSIGYYDADADDGFGQTPGELKWSIVDSHMSGGGQKSIDLDGTVGGQTVTQIHNFDTASGVALADADLVLYRDATGPELKYATAAQLADFIEGDIEIDCDKVNACIDCDVVWDCITDSAKNTHYLLTDIKAGNYAKHDHLGYWMNGDEVRGRAGGADDTYTHNWGSSIGSAANNEVISLTSQILKGNAGDWTVAAPQKLLVLNVTAAAKAAATGALKVTGGVDIGDSLDVTGSIWASALVDAGTSVTAGTTVSAGTSIDSGTFVEAGSYVEAKTLYKVNGTQVVGPQGAAVVDAGAVSATATANGVGFVTTGEMNTFVTDVNTIKDQLNDLLSKVRTHGLIA